MVRANIRGGFLVRLAAIALFCAGIGLWFLYDGAITYPKQFDRAEVWHELDKDGRIDEWPKIARERGWPREKPKDPYDSKVQYSFALVLFPIALVYAIFFLRARNRWIEMHEGTLRTSSGKEVALEDVTKLDKKKWQAKGIAVVHYARDGRAGKLVLDDWKFEPEPTVTMLREVESHIPADAIVGGAPEPPPGEEEDDLDQAEAERA